LRAGRELENKDTTICSILAGGLVGSEASILRDHHQIELGLIEGGAAGAPAEVHKIIFGVEVNIARSLLRLHTGRSGGGLEDRIGGNWSVKDHQQQLSQRPN
jgi:hypothetical protein